MLFDNINCHPSIKIWQMALWRCFDIKKIQNIDLHCPLWLLMMIQDYNTWHNKKIATWHINYILEILNK
jgi:hypothetical protein